MSRFHPLAIYRELRRRRVVQVVLIYAAAAGAVISACDWIFPQIPELVAQPERALRWVIIAALASAPLALILGWLYDVTVEGIQRTPSYSDLAHDPDTSLHRVDRWVIGGLSAAFIGVAAVAVIKIAQLEPPAPPATTAQAKPVVLDPMALAVLPLVDRSAEGESAELLAFGLHDTLLTLLSRISALRVISRTTMDHYQGTAKPLPEIAQELGVANLMEGSVQRVGDQVRVTVQLIRAPNDEHLWAEVYDRELTATNLFQMQTEIARAVAAQLAARLSPEEGQALAIVPTANTEAYTAYMLGRQRLRDRKVEELADAVEQFAHAIELDPNYAAAYSGLADACQLHRAFSGGRVLTGCPTDEAALEDLIRKGLALDDTVGELWVSLGNLLARRSQRSPDDRELQSAANEAFQRGLQLSPSFGQGYHWYALRAGPFGEWLGGSDRDFSINVLLKGLRVDPLSLPLHYQLSYFYDMRGQFEEAFRHAQRMIEIAPDSPRGHERLAELEGGVHGRMDKLILGEARAARLDPQHEPFLENAGWAYMNLGDYDMALRYYARAVSLVEATSDVRHRLDLKRVVAILHLGHRKTAVSLLRQLLETGDAGPWVPKVAAALLVDLSLEQGRPKDALGYLKTGFGGDCFDGDSIAVSCNDVGVKALAVPVLQALGRGDQARQLEPELQTAPQRKGFADVGTAAWRLGWGEPHGIGDVEVLARFGHREQALAALEQAVDQGWRGWEGFWWPAGWKYAQHFSATLSSIRDDPRFQAAFARIEADMSEQLKIVREMERRGEIPSRDELPEPRFDR